MDDKSVTSPSSVSLRSLDYSQDNDPFRRTDEHILPPPADEPRLDLEKGVPPPSTAPLALTDPRSFPDGGLEAWLVVFGGFCCMFCSFGWINCIGVFQAYYQSDLLRELSPSTVSWITSLETFMMFAGGPIVGKLYDNYGPRQLLFWGTILHVFGLMMTSVSTEYYQIILAQGICSPIGASAVFYPAMSAVGTWFFRNRALAFGIMASGSSLGGVVLPIMVQRLIPQIGFSWTMRAVSFMILALLIIGNLTVKSRIPPMPKPFAFLDFVRPLSEPPFALVVLGSLLIFFGAFLPINFVILEARDIGMSIELSSYLLAILNAASIFGRTLPGYLADRFGRFNVTIVMAFMTSLLVLCLWIPARANAPIIVFAALYGFGNGAFVSMAPALVAQISDIRQMGVRTGTLFAVVSIGALCGNPIGGALLSEDGGGYLYLQVFCGTFLFCGACVFTAARWSLVKWKIGAKV